jgi:hypothetical protein
MPAVLVVPLNHYRFAVTRAAAVIMVNNYYAAFNRPLHNYGTGNRPFHNHSTAYMCIYYYLRLCAFNGKHCHNCYSYYF